MLLTEGPSLDEPAERMRRKHLEAGETTKKRGNNAVSRQSVTPDGALHSTIRGKELGKQLTRRNVRSKF